MKNLLKSLILVCALLAVVVTTPASAQTILTPTTLSAALTTSSGTVMTVTSATGFTARTTSAYVDGELMDVNAVSGTTITIGRGRSGTRAVPHISGALVFVGPPNAFAAVSPRGSCTRNNELYLPRIDVTTATATDCVGGIWIQSDLRTGVQTQARWRVYAPEPGGTAYTSLNTTGTATIATELYCSEVWLPTSKLLTGIALLAGTANSTDKHYVALYDNSGVAIANSALAGATGNTTASAYQQYAFTSPYFAVGPAQYFACFQSNGTTDTVRMAVTGVNDNILTKGQTGATFGTLPALTVPTAFTTAVGPYVYLY